jgi:hypothetical protein
VTADGDHVLLAVDPDGISACTQAGSVYRFEPYLDTAETTPSRPGMVGVPTLADQAPAIQWGLYTGVLPSGTTRLDIRLHNGPVTHADVADSTFAVLVPWTGSPVVSCQAYDAAGKLVYSGPLAG